MRESTEFRWGAPLGSATPSCHLPSRHETQDLSRWSRCRAPRLEEGTPEGIEGAGGLPDASGVITLDAMIMDGDTLDCGGVGSLQDIPRAISVARDVMEKTRHVLLVGEGARQFAIREGHEVEALHSENSRRRYRAWLEEKGSERPFWELHEADHDTVGMVGVSGGSCAVGLSTSGLAWKLPGRVGDSPLVGSGGYADSEVGAVAATGIGEHIIRVAGSHSVVEGMRRGLEPREGFVMAIQRGDEEAALYEVPPTP
ncbi:MAG TPA: isoaspartyl peptidase/L-asparaginase [Myxococcota bacterium]|nr:isoaspartyl peptidase/L-asparaginase [Myxococcota bacterium]